MRIVIFSSFNYQYSLSLFPSDHFHNYSSITCDFEEAELCYYVQEPLYDDIDFQWLNSDYADYWVPIGPDVDHTRQDELGK